MILSRFNKIAVYKKLVVLLSIILLNGCGILYEPDIQQGNVITQEMLDKVQIGMSRSEVEYHLGSPLIEDPFHADRWDYYYNYRRGRAKTQQQNIITLFFENDRLSDVRGNSDLYNVDAEHPEAPDLTDRNVEKESLWKRITSF